MPKGHPPDEYYDDPDDQDAYDEYGPDDAAYYDPYTEYDEYTDYDASAERHEVAPDDAEPSFELYDAVYQKASAKAESKLERPRRSRRAKPVEPPPPGPLRALWLRSEPALLRFVLAAAAITLVFSLFAVLWTRSDADNQSAQAPSIAPPVVRCGDAASAWPLDVPITGHTIPALIKNELSWPGEQHGYQFHGGAGQIWKITVEPRGESGLDPLVRLFDESGREVAGADDRSAQDYTAELTFHLPQTGAYCVLVESAQGGLTAGVYWLSAWIVE